MALSPLIIKTLQKTPMSLADLQTTTQVSLPTLRKAVQELSENHWVRIQGQAEAKGGRPAMLFGLDDSYYSLLGVHLQLPGMRLVLSDLNGRILYEQEYYQGEQPSPEDVVQTVVDFAGQMDEQFSDRRILGVGIATPGFTNPNTGDIISIGRVAGWQNFPICQRLSMSLRLPVRIANDVDCMAFAEFQTSGKPFDRNLAYFGFDEGLKVSIFLNGELYKGSFGNAGLILPRLLFVPDTVITQAYQQRLLTISGINQIFEELVNALPQSERTTYRQLIDANYRQRLTLILEHGEQGDLPVCQTILQMLTDVLAVAVINIIYVLQPDAIVLGGILSGIQTSTLSQINAAIRSNLPTLFANHIQIEQAQVTSSNSAALGAIYHFLDEYLVPDTFNLTEPILS